MTKQKVVDVDNKIGDSLIRSLTPQFSHNSDWEYDGRQCMTFVRMKLERIFRVNK